MPACPGSRCICQGCKDDRAAYRRRLRGSTNGPQQPAKHGSAAMYQKKCRCSTCKFAQNERQRRYRATGSTLAPEIEGYDETYGGML